jgi:putative peptide zinc metalloprotease protein
MTRRLTALFAAFLASFSLAVAPIAVADDNAAVAVNTKDDSFLYKLAFDITRLFSGQDTVDASNAAAAVASCESCETVAVAIQVVLVSGSPTVVIPENLALAMNIDCQSCETLATAYQYVLSVGDGPVKLTGEGQRRIAEIRRQLQALRNSGLGIEEIQAQVVDLNNQLVEVLRTELVPANPNDQPSDTGSTGTETAPADTTSTETTPSETGTETTPSDTTGTETTPSDTGTQTTPSGTTGTTGTTG